MSTGNTPQGRTWEIGNGWDVMTSDNQKLGEVEEIHPYYLVVGKGLLFHSEKYVPVATIVDVRDDTVHINATKEEVENHDWDTAPDVAGMGRTPDTAGRGGRSDAVGRTNAGGQRRQDTDIEIPVVEEELEVRKRPVDAGTVRVHKDVVESEKHISVPVREERIRVERHDVNEPAPANLSEQTFEEQDIEVPLRTEEVEVSKRPVVRERVNITKDVVERDEQASRTVRREDVHVEGENTGEHADRP